MDDRGFNLSKGRSYIEEERDNVLPARSLRPARHLRAAAATGKRRSVCPAERLSAAPTTLCPAWCLSTAAPTTLWRAPLCPAWPEGAQSMGQAVALQRRYLTRPQ